LLDALVERRSGLISRVEPLCDALAQVYFADRYPGFDLDEPDWDPLRAYIVEVSLLLDVVKSRIPVWPTSTS
jgi:hypothetical protein